MAVVWDANKNTSARKIVYALVKGGRWEVGSGTAVTGTPAEKSFTTAFQPVGLNIMSVNYTPTVAVQSRNLIELSSSDGTTQTLVAAVDIDAVATTETGTLFRTDRLLESFTANATGPTAATVVASIPAGGLFNALDFTLDYTTVHAAWNAEFIWMACAGNEATNGPLLLLGVGT